MAEDRRQERPNPDAVSSESTSGTGGTGLPLPAAGEGPETTVGERGLTNLHGEGGEAASPNPGLHEDEVPGAGGAKHVAPGDGATPSAHMVAPDAAAAGPGGGSGAGAPAGAALGGVGGTQTVAVSGVSEDDVDEDLDQGLGEGGGGGGGAPPRPTRFPRRYWLAAALLAPPLLGWVVWALFGDTGREHRVGWALLVLAVFELAVLWLVEGIGHATENKARDGSATCPWSSEWTASRRPARRWSRCGLWCLPPP